MKKEADWMKEESEDFYDLATIDDKIDPEKLSPQIYDIADINFGKDDMTTNFLLLKMGGI